MTNTNDMQTISSAELRDNKTIYVNRTKQDVSLIHRRNNESFVLPEQDDLPKDFDHAISMDEAIERVEAGMKRIIDGYKPKSIIRNDFSCQ